MSNRIAVFNDGVIQQLSTPAELYERPQNSFVAQFIGENNKLKGRVKTTSVETCAVEIPGGGTVEAMKIKVSGAGSDTLISIRPERVEINPDAPDVSNRMAGTVAETIYLGDHVRVVVKVPGSDSFVVKTPNKEGTRPLAVGENVTVGWRTKDCRALDLV
jgi:putative spermidine/putrescine transport system ATP-binding protein